MIPLFVQSWLSWCNALCLLCNGFLLKGSPLLCLLCNSSVVQVMWCRVIISLVTTSRRLWNNNATTIKTKMYFDHRKSTLPNPRRSIRAAVAVWAQPWILDLILQLFIYLDWIDTAHCIVFLMPLNNSWLHYLLFFEFYKLEKIRFS